MRAGGVYVGRAAVVCFWVLGLCVRVDWGVDDWGWPLESIEPMPAVQSIASQTVTSKESTGTRLGE